ncbi:MAG: hypothetical protein KC549_05755 [Myxococcales bacterium]|nr:hypothetical protein [Myxococcales bacterium]
MKSKGLPLLALGLMACGGHRIRTQTPAPAAIAEATARLKARGIPLDAEGQRPDRLRTSYLCHLPGQAWDVTLLQPGTAPVPFTAEGTLDEQAAARARCPLLLQIEVAAQAGADTEMQVVPAWWRLEDRGCQPIGEPLLGRLRCEYGYRGAAVDEDPSGYVYGVLAGI